MIFCSLNKFFQPVRFGEGIGIEENQPFSTSEAGTDVIGNGEALIFAQDRPYVKSRFCQRNSISSNEPSVEPLSTKTISKSLYVCCVRLFRHWGRTLPLFHVAMIIETKNGLLFFMNLYLKGLDTWRFHQVQLTKSISGIRPFERHHKTSLPCPVNTRPNLFPQEKVF